ncbi:MAG TPA: cardiolipin synthase ClsB [Ideonella sp.]|uniref:cardiolipin synthase ClsB n=1 Tax=Ideonella sp. TaxID=1929293 RepID=UPI002E3334EB|nr:cardiolipin synthase ClsB [Ideonella sp.]HEX5686428.1 cardiolipin synthase ClsB [Ideonella sp.]
MKTRWFSGNRVDLLENGEAFFPAVFDAIRHARREVILETFIVFEDKVGQELHEVLLAAARRGVQVDVLVDGFGSADLSPAYVQSLTAVGVRVRTFDPAVRVLGFRFNVLRRMHRKIVVIDGERAFVGGINYSADHLADFGPQAKQDYSVELVGPIVGEIHRFVRTAIHDPVGDVINAGHGLRAAWGRWHPHGPQQSAERAAVNAGSADALFVRRDNLHHRNDIERYYCIAVRRARKQVLIANAYFFPGYRLLRELRRAAGRGVEVKLVLQGEPDVPIARTAASTLYDYLHGGGVKIYEYCERPLHGKVAVIDDEWSTVGSSNLDPLSLSLNLEANVVLRDKPFAQHLRTRLEHLIERSCKQIEVPAHKGWVWWAQVRGFVVFHFLRRFPVWASHLPAHAPKLELLAQPHAHSPARPHAHATGSSHAR